MSECERARREAKNGTKLIPVCLSLQNGITDKQIAKSNKNKKIIYKLFSHVSNICIHKFLWHKPKKKIVSASKKAWEFFFFIFLSNCRILQNHLLWCDPAIHSCRLFLSHTFFFFTLFSVIAHSINIPKSIRTKEKENL